MLETQRIHRHPRLTVIGALVLALWVTPTLAQLEPSSAADEWQYTGALYVWGSDIGGTTLDGSPIKVKFRDLFDNLEIGFMGVIEARKAKWSVFADMIYMDVAADGTADVSIPVGPVQVPVTTAIDVDLDGLIVHLKGGYNLYSKDKSWLDVTFGARYLDLEVDMFLELQSLGPGQSRTVADSLSSFDGIVGLKGNTALNDKWSVPYYVDIGAGDAEFTWQASAGVLYKASDAVNVALVYRHLEWDIDDSARVVDDIDFSGPALGVVFRW